MPRGATTIERDGVSETSKVLLELISERGNLSSLQCGLTLIKELRCGPEADA